MEDKPQPQPQPNQAAAQPAILRATIQIKRAATGKVEEYQIVGTPLPQPAKD